MATKAAREAGKCSLLPGRKEEGAGIGTTEGAWILGDEWQSPSQKEGQRRSYFIEVSCWEGSRWRSQEWESNELRAGPKGNTLACAGEGKIKYTPGQRNLQEPSGHGVWGLRQLNLSCRHDGCENDHSPEGSCDIIRREQVLWVQTGTDRE